MKFVVGCVLLTIFFSNVVTAQDAGWERITKTRNASIVCIAQNSVRLDDRQTSPEIIARAGFQVCKPSIGIFSDAFFAKAYEMVPTDPQGTRDAEIQKKLNQILVEFENLAIQAILENRASTND